MYVIFTMLEGMYARESVPRMRGEVSDYATDVRSHRRTANPLSGLLYTPAAFGDLTFLFYSCPHSNHIFFFFLTSALPSAHQVLSQDPRVQSEHSASLQH